MCARWVNLRPCENMNNSGRASLQEGMLSTVYMALAARAVWRHRPMYSQWLTGSIPGTVNLRRSRRLLRSAAIRKPAAGPLYSETPIFHTEHLKSELCTLLFKEREKAGERRKIFLKISGRDWFPDGRGYLVCLPGNQFRWSLIEQRSLVCNVKYCIAFCDRKFPNPSFTATPVIRKLNIFKYQTYVRAFSSHIHCAQCTHRLSKLIKGSSLPSITNTLIKGDLIWKTYNKEKNLGQKMSLISLTFGQGIGKPYDYIHLTPLCQ